MKIEKSAQDLSTPMLHCSDVNSLVLQPIPISQLKQVKIRKKKKQFNYTRSKMHKNEWWTENNVVATKELTA